ncbi:GntR family transcriptional regulator [Bacillus shivajii]|uniref:GntR family transcriptional regulator n=1 Tax=Bacillus shivajii TaxID=1983719 RepID=UPI001CFB2D09|nr:GntR family transcriptional regulator [Bacillus shivajii]UCZ51564.1 GntR family transcriptional regulator [Bacillus shivajii]
MALQFDNDRPIYIQLMEHIYGKICRSEWKPGEKLPSVRETAIEAGVNPNTVSRAYMEMERESVVESKRGQGTFVTEDGKVIESLKITTAEKQINAFLLAMGKIGLSKEETVELVKKQIEREKAGETQNDDAND